MNKLLKVTSVLQLVFAIGALTLAIMLFQKRELLKGRTLKLERGITAMAATIETGTVEAEKKSSYPARDTEEVTASLVSEPQTSDFWKSYRYEMEQSLPRTIDLSGRRHQLTHYYQRDPITLKVVRDPLTGARLTSGPGTMQDLIEGILDAALDQLGRLNDTRAELQKTRIELVETITDLNSRKTSLRVALNTVENRDRAIVKLQKDVRTRDGHIGDLEEELVGLGDAMREKDRTLNERDGAIEDLTADVASLEAQVAELTGDTTPKPLPGAWETLPRGHKGSVAAVNPEWNFVVLRLTDAFLQHYLTVVQTNPHATDPDLVVARIAQDGSCFVTKVRLCQVDASRGLAIATPLTAWSQSDIRKGDTLVF